MVAGREGYLYMIEAVCTMYDPCLTHFVSRVRAVTAGGAKSVYTSPDIPHTSHTSLYYGPIVPWTYCEHIVAMSFTHTDFDRPR